MSNDGPNDTVLRWRGAKEDALVETAGGWEGIGGLRETPATPGTSAVGTLGRGCSEASERAWGPW